MSKIDNTAFASLFSRRAQDLIKPGLERVGAAYAALDHPSLATPTILIAGTNGKGSTSSFLWLLLQQSLERVGLYTSPHLVDFAERMRCSHRFITNQDLLDQWHDLQLDLSKDMYESLSFFEMTTLMAFRLFAAEQTSANVIEVGLGGRWDATNILDPLASVIVSISYDHQAYLGDTLAAITSEKLGILRSARPLFVGGGGYLFRDPEAQRVLETTVAAHRCPLYRFGREFLIEGRDLVIQCPGQAAIKVALPPELTAPFLQENFALAAAIYHWLRETRQTEWKLKPLADVVPVVFSQAREWPPSLKGRFWPQEVLLDGEPQKLLFDVCHNVNGVEEFIRALQANGVSPHQTPALISILGDKDFNGMLDLLRSFFDPIVLFNIPSERSFKHEKLADRHGSLSMFPNFAAAFEFAAKHWSRGGTWAVCGSVLAVGHSLEYLAAFQNNSSRHDPSGVLSVDARANNS